MFIRYHGVLKWISDTFLGLISRHFKLNNSPTLRSASPLTSFPLLCCRSTPTTSWRRRPVTGGTWPSQEAWPCQSSPPLSSQPSASVRKDKTGRLLCTVNLSGWRLKQTERCLFISVQAHEERAFLQNEKYSMLLGFMQLYFEQLYPHKI